MQDFINDYEAACTKLGRSTELPDVSMYAPKKAKRVIAAHKLDMILDANNDGWEADLSDTNQEKWYPWFRVVKDSKVSAGFRLAFIVAVYTHGGAHLGARPACKSEELAVWMGNNCIPLYEELLG